MQKEKFSLGDLVSYEVQLENSAYFRVIGRVLGRMNANLSTYFGSNSHYRYLVETFLDIPEDDKLVDWMIVTDHADVVRGISEQNFHLDWGRIPKVLDKRYFGTVDEAELFFVIDEETNRKFLKDAGHCKDCGHRGEWISLGLICPYHGKFAG